MRKVHYRAILAAMAALPLLAQAGPITSYNVGVQGGSTVDIAGTNIGGDQEDWNVTPPKGWEGDGGAKWLNGREHSGRHNQLLTGPLHREQEWRRGELQDDHGRHYAGRASGAHIDREPPARSHVDGRDSANAVPDASSTALLLLVALGGLAAFAQGRPTTASR